MPAFARTARRATVAPMPISAQIIHDGKYEPRMFLDGAELHPLNSVSAAAVETRSRSLPLTPVEALTIVLVRSMGITRARRPRRHISAHRSRLAACGMCDTGPLKALSWLARRTRREGTTHR